MCLKKKWFFLKKKNRGEINDRKKNGRQFILIQFLSLTNYLRMEPFAILKINMTIDVGLQNQDIIIRRFATSTFKTVHFVKKKKIQNTKIPWRILQKNLQEWNANL